jgi:ATP-binding cassette subfamily B protein
VREYPAHRSVVLRLLEPLGASDAAVSEAPGVGAAAPVVDEASRGTRIEMRHVSVRAAGHQVLANIDLEIESGGHVAIVGASGAGKSTLVGMLGWHRAATGTLLVDDRPLSRAHLDALRRETAWVDPRFGDLNRSLLENLLDRRAPCSLWRRCSKPPR